jgi:ABC-type tungstate transport system permease subunit
MTYPLEALRAAILLKEFTITDRGAYLTLLSKEESLKDQITIYKTGESEPELLNPAHLLVGSKAQNKPLAQDFSDWVRSQDGQTVIANFHHQDNGQCLYKPYPSVNEVQPSNCSFLPQGSKAPSERMEL